MKIPLNMGQNGTSTTKVAQAKMLERDVVAAKKGDWDAKNSVIRTFLPLITALAEKRAADPAQRNEFVEAGKEGLLTAVRKYSDSVGGEKFRIFALDYIEAEMNRLEKGGGFFARLFGRK